MDEIAGLKWYRGECAADPVFPQIWQPPLHPFYLFREPAKFRHRLGVGRLFFHPEWLRLLAQKERFVIPILLKE